LGASGKRWFSFRLSITPSLLFLLFHYLFYDLFICASRACKMIILPGCHCKLQFIFGNSLIILLNNFLQEVIPLQKSLLAFFYKHFLSFC
jgi:hypothetical protein